MRTDVQPEKWASSYSRQVDGSAAIVNLIAGKMLPTSIVGSDEFFKVFSIVAPHFTLPHRERVVETLISREVKKIEDHIRAMVSEAAVSVTVDIWTTRQNRSFLGIHGQILDEKFKITSFLFSCFRFNGRHTARNITDNFEKALAKYDLSGKVDFIISDNAANMVSAFDLPTFATVEADFVDSDSILHVNDDVTLDSLYEFMPKHERCFAHSLQLVIKHALSNTTGILEPLGKVRDLVAFIRRSNVAGDFLIGEIRPQTAIPVRWNSQLMSVRSILAIDNIKLDSLPGISEEQFLTVRERLILKEFVEIMVGFEEATNRVQGELVVTASWVIPCIMGLQKHLEKTWTWNRPLVQSLSFNMSRVSQYLSKKHFRRATMLDPRFKLSCFQNAEEDREDLQNLIEVFIYAYK